MDFYIGKVINLQYQYKTPTELRNIPDENPVKALKRRVKVFSNTKAIFTNREREWKLLGESIEELKKLMDESEFYKFIEKSFE